MSETHTEPVQPAAPPWRDLLVLLIAAGALAFFAWLTVNLLGHAGDQSETAWARGLYLYHGIEALAFAAAGFLFGREVQRRRADQAEERAAEAEQSAVSATVRGDTLAESIRAEAAATEALGAVPESMEGGQAAPAANVQHLVALADRLFPRHEHR